MPTTTAGPNVHTSLRDKAEAQLQAGTTPKSGHWSMGVDALRLLHQLSSDPDKAHDAIKLLHELQVHQVELDLQNEAMASNEQALAEDLAQYQALYDHAPMAYCVVKTDGAVVHGNWAAAELFGIAKEALAGQRIDRLLNPQSRAALLGLLERVARSGASDSCVGEPAAGAQGAGRLQFLASAAAGQEHLLLACCPCAHAQ